MPTRARNVSAVALRLPQRGEVWLFDCGEGTQHQLLRSDLNISQITRIFITHLHGDHVYGLMGLLATCGMSGHARRVDVYGPRGLEQYVKDVSRRTQLYTSYPLEVHTVEEGRVFEDEEFAVSCAPRLLVFPSVTHAAETRAERLSQAETMARLLRMCPWSCYDRPAARAHLGLLSRLARQCVAFDLFAGRDLLGDFGRTAALVASLAGAEER